MRTVALIVAIVLGIVAAIGVRSYLKAQQVQFQRQVRPVKVAVARRTIEADEELTQDMIELEEIPANMLTTDMIVEQELGRYVGAGRKVTRNLDKGTQIRVGHFISRELRVAAERLTEGKRAITVAVDATSGVAGLVRPGDHVDIVATTTGTRRAAPTTGAAPETWKVLSDVTVLAVDDRMTETAAGITDYRSYRRGYSSFTLAVTPLEAQILSYLKDNAKLTFVLRPRTELGEKQGVPTIDGSNVRELAGQANTARQEEIQKLEEVQLRP